MYLIFAFFCRCQSFFLALLAFLQLPKKSLYIIVFGVNGGYYIMIACAVGIIFYIDNIPFAAHYPLDSVQLLIFLVRNGDCSFTHI